MRLTCRKLQSGPDSGRKCQAAGGLGQWEPGFIRCKNTLTLGIHPTRDLEDRPSLCSQSVQPARCSGCVSFSGTSSAFISAWLMMPSDSATWAMVPPLDSAVLAISAAFS
jgi:hypothetical protein